MSERVFTFNMDLCKSESSDDENRLVRGLASCEEVDGQGEVVLQKGMDCEPALKSGWVNWDHMPGPENLIGIPTRLEVAEISNHPIMRKSGLHGFGCYAEARLLKGHPRADAVWSLLKASETTNRQLAWSIQGAVLERSGNRNNVLASTAIRHLAITHQPVQTRSFAEVVKSLNTVSAGPMKLETIDHGPIASPTIKNILYGNCFDSHYTKKGGFRGGFEGMLEHLVDCKGFSLDDSKQFVRKLIKSKMSPREVLLDER